MVNTFEGLLTVKDEKFCIVISRFNEFIGSKLIPNLIGGFGLAMTNIVTPLVALLIKNFPSMLLSLGKAIIDGIKIALPGGKIKNDAAEDYRVLQPSLL